MLDLTEEEWSELEEFEDTYDAKNQQLEEVMSFPNDVIIYYWYYPADPQIHGFRVATKDWKEVYECSDFSIALLYANILSAERSE